MSRKILVLGATGTLGRPAVRALVHRGHRIRVLARCVEKARRLSGYTVEILQGSARSPDRIGAAMSGCDAVHISLPQASELTAMKSVVDAAPGHNLERVTYVSATTAVEENRWFGLIDEKMRAEEVLRRSGLAHTVFCPSWAMETLRNFVHGGRAVVISGRKPPPLHFFAAEDFGRMVAASYEDERALGRRLFVHGPEGVTLPDALERYVESCHPGLRVLRMKLWQARLIARLTGRESLRDVARLIAYFDEVGELGDPTEANELLGAPSVTLSEWFKLANDRRTSSADY